MRENKRQSTRKEAHTNRHTTNRRENMDDGVGSSSGGSRKYDDNVQLSSANDLHMNENGINYANNV